MARLNAKHERTRLILNGRGALMSIARDHYDKLWNLSPEVWNDTIECAEYFKADWSKDHLQKWKGNFSSIGGIWEILNSFLKRSKFPLHNTQMHHMLHAYFKLLIKGTNFFTLWLQDVIIFLSFWFTSCTHEILLLLFHFTFKFFCYFYSF